MMEKSAAQPWRRTVWTLMSSNTSLAGIRKVFFERHGILGARQVANDLFRERTPASLGRD